MAGRSSLAIVDLTRVEPEVSQRDCLDVQAVVPPLLKLRVGHWQHCAASEPADVRNGEPNGIAPHDRRAAKRYDNVCVLLVVDYRHRQRLTNFTNTTGLVTIQVNSCAHALDYLISNANIETAIDY